MLTLNGTRVEIGVGEVRAGNVQLLFDAPDCVRIDREEIADVRRQVARKMQILLGDR